MEERYDLAFEKTALGKALLGKMKEIMNVEDLDEETSRDIEKIVILRLSTKHINLWIRQLEVKRKEISELAGLMMLEEVKKEVEKEKNLEKWAKQCTTHFTRKTKRMLFEEIDNIVWSEKEKKQQSGARGIRCLMKSPKKKFKRSGSKRTQTMKNQSDSMGSSSGKRQRECATSSMHTMTSSTSLHSESTEW